MRKFLLLILGITFCIPYNLSAQTTSDKEHYRRSSLTLILLTHGDKKYAAGMERVFKSFPLPARYNEHNISDLRVISVKGKQSKKDIDNLLINNKVGQRVVERWFNRDPYSGEMNMDLIHDRGGYGAFYEDYQRSQSTVRGTSMLRDEGIELLQSTFVLVCDMDYIDKKKGAAWGALGLGLLSLGMEAMAQSQYSQAQRQINSGNYSGAKRSMEQAQAWSAGSTLGMAGASVVGDIGGFRVKMNAYLYKLNWNDYMTMRMYDNYWADENTPYSEKQEKKEKFEDEGFLFSLDYVGKYQASSSKTILRSWKDEDEVILDVCKRCVSKGMKELAKSFPIFRPRSPFYFDEGLVYSHIGSKEDVETGKKYEIVQPYKDKKGQIQYKSVGKAKAGYPWDNRDVRFDEYFDPEQKGTLFFCKNSSVDLHTPGLQLREL